MGLTMLLYLYGYWTSGHVLVIGRYLYSGDHDLAKADKKNCVAWTIRHIVIVK